MNFLGPPGRGVTRAVKMWKDSRPLHEMLALEAFVKGSLDQVAEAVCQTPED